MIEKFEDTVSTLPFDWYHNKDIFIREKKSIFDREWLPLGPLDSLKEPGHWFQVSLTGTHLVCVVGSDNIPRAFHNVCRHRGAPIVDPAIAIAGTESCDRLRRLTCPYHGWVYELDGQLAAAPGFDLDTLEHERKGLHEIRTAAWNGTLWGCLDSGARDFDDWLGDVQVIASRFKNLSQFEFQTSLRNQAHANWKTYGDNSAEGYHLDYVHPELSQSITGDTEIRPYPNGRFIGFDVTYRTQNKFSTDTDKGFWIYKFPGVLLHFSEHSFNIERVTPVKPGLIELTRWFWFHPDVDETSRQRTIEQSNIVMDQDIGICERVQVNLDQGNLDKGVLSRSREPGTIYFQGLVRKALSNQ